MYDLSINLTYVLKYIRTYVQPVYTYSYTLRTICMYMNIVVVILTPPENITAIGNSDVTISCGYQWSRALPVTWIINGTSFNQQEVVDSPLYQPNNSTIPMSVSLTVFSINGTTTFQCAVQSTPSISISPHATVNILGTYVPICTQYA